MSWTLIQNTLVLSAGTVVVAGLFGVAVFLLSLLLPQRWGQFVPLLAGVNLLLPQYLVVAVWMRLAGYSNLVDWGAYHAMGFAILIISLLAWPVTFFFLWIRRRALFDDLSIDPLVDGWNFIQLLWISLRGPLCWAGVVTFALAANNLSVPGILQVRVFAEEILVRFNTELDLASVSWLGLPLFVVALGVSAWVLRRQDWFVSGGRASGREWLAERLGLGQRGLILMLGAFVLLLGVAVPLAGLLLVPETWRELSVTWKASRSAISYSVGFAVLGSLLVVGSGWLLRRLPGAKGLWCLLIIPGTLLGAYLAWGHNQLGALGIDLGAFVVVAGLCVRFVGVGISGVMGIHHGVQRELIELARLDSVRGWERFRLCYWPSGGPGVLALLWVVYLLCLWEVEVLLFLVPPGVETVGLRVFNLLHYGHNSQVNASCLLLLLLGIAPGVLWWGWQQARGKFFSARTLCVGLTLLVCGVGCERSPESDGLLESAFFERAEVLGRKGTGVGQFNKPRSVAVGGDDEVFAVDMTGRVQRFDSQGEYLGFWQMPETERGRPKGMGVDAEGRIVVVEPHYCRVNHFTPEGELCFQWGVRGKETGLLAFPRSVAVHSSGDLFISEFQSVERIQRFSPTGSEFRFSFGQAGWEPGNFNRAEGMGIDRENRLFVADSCNHRIQVFDETGALLETYGRPGDGLGELSYPYDVRIDGEGFQYVCEFGNSRIQIFDREFQPVEIIGGPGSGLGEFSNPWALALDSRGNLWVADSGNHRLQKLVRRQVP